MEKMFRKTALPFNESNLHPLWVSSGLQPSGNQVGVSSNGMAAILPVKWSTWKDAGAGDPDA
jgi:hypothetical protein